MIRDFRTGWAVLFWALVTAGGASAQQLSFRGYDEGNGLPSPDVNAVVQDLEGCIWVATRAGIARYDGYEWKRFEIAVGGIGGFGTLHAAPDGGVWLVPSHGPWVVSTWDGRGWSDHPEAPGSNLGTVVDAALASVDGEDVLLVAGTAPAGLQLLTRGEWSAVELDILPLHVVPGRGGFLIAHEEGLGRLDPRTGVFEPVPGLPSGPVLGATEEPGRGWTWVVGVGWLGRIGPAGFELLHDGVQLGTYPYSMRLAPDGFGGLVFGNPLGVLHYEGSGALERLDRNSGHVAGAISDLCLDRERNLWMASTRGLSKLTSLRFGVMDSKHGLLGDEVSALLRLRSGSMVLGHRYGLTFLGDELRVLELSDDPVQARVMDLAEDEDGTLWIAASYNGVARIPPGGDLEWVQTTEDVAPLAMALHFDERGVLWIGGMDGLVAMRDGELQPHPASTAFGRRMTVRSIASRGDRLLLATMEFGALELAGGELVLLGDPDTRPLDTYSVMYHTDGSIWIGSRDGLTVLGGGPVSLEALGALKRPVYSLAESPGGDVWLGSDDGMRRWKDGELEHFGVSDGVIGAEANRHAVAFGDQGQVWFGTDRGLNVYRPEYDVPRPHGPTVRVLSASANGEPFGLDVPATLEADRDSLSFRIRAIAFANEDLVRFRTRLEGLEAEFSEPTVLPTREIRYPHLPPGTYRLHVRAITPDGQESDLASTQAITVRPPLAQRPWFRAVAGTAAVLTVLLLGAFLAQRRHSGRLEGAVRERTLDLETSRATIAAESERLSAVLTSIQDAVVVLDTEGRVVLWNDAAVDLFGVPRERSVGENLEELLGQPLPEAGDLQIATESGAGRTLELSRSPIQGAAPGLGGTVLAFRDLTLRLRTEAERRKTQQLESLGILAGGIAHDFNNLLTVLLGNLSLVQAERGASKSIGDAMAAVRQAESLTKQLLTFSKGGAPALHATSIPDLVRESATFVLLGASTRPEFRLPEDLWNVDVDAGQIGQVIQNLLLNAREAMSSGGLVTITAENSSPGPEGLPPGRYVAIHVQDGGPGIPPDEIHRVFDPYFSTKNRGSGLGLTTAYSIVERHGGRLCVHSRVGEGCTFSVYLPASGGGRIPAGNVGETTENRPAKILVLDDEPRIRRVLSLLLERAGHEVTAVADGHVVVDLYRRAQEAGTPFEILLLDLTIPGGCGGKEALEMLRATYPDVRAIVASGYSDDAVLANPELYGFAAAVKKPFSKSQVLEAISRVQGGEPSARGTNPG